MSLNLEMKAEWRCWLSIGSVAGSVLSTLSISEVWTGRTQATEHCLDAGRRPTGFQGLRTLNPQSRPVKSVLNRPNPQRANRQINSSGSTAPTARSSEVSGSSQAKPAAGRNKTSIEDRHPVIADSGKQAEKDGPHPGGNTAKIVAESRTEVLNKRGKQRRQIHREKRKDSLAQADGREPAPQSPTIVAPSNAISQRDGET